jgi:hypothetical protein
MIGSNVISIRELRAAVQSCLDHEQRTGCECAIVYDGFGKLVGKFTGEKDVVTLPVHVLEEAKHGVLIHNHPGSSGSFSDVDLFSASNRELAEIWVCLQDGSLFKSAGFIDIPRMLYQSEVFRSYDKVFPTIRAQEETFNQFPGEIKERILSHTVMMQLLKNKSLKSYEWHLGPLMQQAMAEARNLLPMWELLQENDHDQFQYATV